MAEPSRTSRSLSDISHLFLSSVRERQTGGAAMPLRRPPGSFSQDEVEPLAPKLESRINLDLTPEEMHVASSDEMDEEESDTTATAPVSALLASHLGCGQFDAARRYARNLAAAGQRVGLISIDVSEFRLSMFEPTSEHSPEPVEIEENGVFDARAMTDAINELNCDLDCWLVLVANPRVAEGRSLLAKMEHWVLLSAAGHEGVVAGYRTLKGISDLDRPRLSLATLDPKSPEESEQVYRKLASVCSQFLDWRIEPEPAVTDVLGVTEIPVLLCRTTGDKAQVASATHWQVVLDFLGGGSSAGTLPRPVPLHVVDEQPASLTVTHEQTEPQPASSGPRLKLMEPEMPKLAPTASMPASAPRMVLHSHQASPSVPEVIDLPEGELTDGVVGAVMKHAMNELIECPVRAPMCPQARLAVTRDRRIVVIAMAGQGLTDLRAIGLAYRWVVENRALLGMAMPQFALDAHQHPTLRLLVDQTDVDADILQPIFQVDTVSIHTYRRVRWGERTGLLLNAA